MPLLVRRWDWGEEGESRLGVANPGLWDVPQSPAEAGGDRSKVSPPGPAPSGGGYLSWGRSRSCVPELMLLCARK